MKILIDILKHFKLCEQIINFIKYKENLTN